MVREKPSLLLVIAKYGPRASFDLSTDMQRQDIGASQSFKSRSSKHLCEPSDAGALVGMDEVCVLAGGQVNGETSQMS